MVREGMLKIISDIQPFEVSYTEITNFSRKPNNKCPYEYRWVALLFNDYNLKNFAIKSNALLKSLNLYATDMYFTHIKDVDPGVTKEEIANHMHMCNYCRPDKAEEAVKIVREKVPQNFTVDKVAYRNADGSLGWVLILA